MPWLSLACHFFPSSDSKQYAAGPWQEANPVQSSEAEADELLEANHENPGSSGVLPPWNLQWFWCHGYHLYPFMCSLLVLGDREVKTKTFQGHQHSMVTVYDDDSGCTFSVTAIAAPTFLVQPSILVVVVVVSLSPGYGLPY